MILFQTNISVQSRKIASSVINRIFDSGSHQQSLLYGESQRGNTQGNSIGENNIAWQQCLKASLTLPEESSKYKALQYYGYTICFVFPNRSEWILPMGHYSEAILWLIYHCWVNSIIDYTEIPKESSTKLIILSKWLDSAKRELELNCTHCDVIPFCHKFALTFDNTLR